VAAKYRDVKRAAPRIKPEHRRDERHFTFTGDYEERDSGTVALFEVPTRCNGRPSKSTIGLTREACGKRAENLEKMGTIADQTRKAIDNWPAE